MKYICEICNYETCDNTHLNRHFMSNKHIAKSTHVNNNNILSNTKVTLSNTKITQSNTTSNTTSNTKLKFKDNLLDFYSAEFVDQTLGESFECEFCGKEFSKKNSFYRHKKHFCKNNTQLAKPDDEVSILKKQVANLEKEVEKKDAEKDIYKTENEFHKNMTVNAGNVVGKTMSALTYIMTNYNNAPQIQRLDDKSAMKLLMYETKDGKITKLITDKTPLQYLIDLYEYEKLIPHLGNIIVSKYKKLNPEDQSFWNTDSSRLSYVIRDTSGIAKSKKTMWDNDKRGIKISEYIIKPLLTQIYNMIIAYDKSIYAMFDKMTSSERDKYVENTKFTLELKESISKGSLNKELLRHITPYFYISKKFN